MGKIKNLPLLDRPREKAIRYGLESLSDYELLAVLLGSGYQGNNVIELSTYLISKYGGLSRLVDIPFSELKKNKGIKNVKALKLAAIFEFHKRLSIRNNEESERDIDTEYLYNKYVSRLINEKQEHLILVILSRKKKIIHEEILYKGSSDGLKYSWEDISDKIVSFGGKYFYLIHNHPGGSCRPSPSDRMATSEIMLCGKRFKKPMLDHLIIGVDGYYSFKNEKN